MWDTCLDGRHRHEQVGGDRGVGQSAGDEPCDLGSRSLSSSASRRAQPGRAGRPGRPRARLPPPAHGRAHGPAPSSCGSWLRLSRTHRRLARVVVGLPVRIEGDPEPLAQRSAGPPTAAQPRSSCSPEPATQARPSRLVSMPPSVTDLVLDADRLLSRVSAAGVSPSCHSTAPRARSRSHGSSCPPLAHWPAARRPPGAARRQAGRRWPPRSHGSRPTESPNASSTRSISSRPWAARSPASSAFPRRR